MRLPSPGLRTALLLAAAAAPARAAPDAAPPPVATALPAPTAPPSSTAASRAAPAAASTARELYVLHLASLRQDDYQAIRLTKALEQRALASREERLINSNQALLVLLERGRCGAAFRESAFAGAAAGFDEAAGQSIEPDCLAKLAAMLGAPGEPAPQFLWGYVHRDGGGRLRATVHLWRRGGGDRRLTVPVDERAPADAPAARLYRRLLATGPVGDVRVEAPAGAAGELYVDGRPQGAFRAGDEVTLDAGDRAVELRRGGERVAAGRVRVEPGATVVARLAPAGAAGGAARPSRTLPWALAGVGAAGLAGALTFHLLRRGAENDLERRCVSGQWCFPSEHGTIDRADRYATYSAVSLGVAAAGLGAGAWLFLSRPKAGAATTGGPVTGVAGGLHPIAGGAGASVGGRF